MKILISVISVLVLLILFVILKSWKVVLILKSGKLKLKVGWITVINPNKKKKKNKDKEKEEKYIKIPKVSIEQVKEKFDGVKELYKNEKEEIVYILKETAKKADIRQVNASVTYGFGNAAITGMTNGFIWTAVTAVVAVVKKYVNIEKKLNLAVYPEFSEECFDVYLLLEMRVRVANFLKIALRAKKIYEKAKHIYNII